MKIGIYTLPFKTNYGGILQAWALQNVLEKMGHQVEVIMPVPVFRLKCKWYIKPLVYSKRFLKNFLKLSSNPIFWEKAAYYKLGKNLRNFTTNNIKIAYYKQFEDIKNHNYDLLIVGSDQIWRPKYNKSNGIALEDSFFNFAKDWNVQKISYAASFGVDYWEYNEEETKLCKQLISQFKAVSVRETSGIQLCKEHFGVDAKLLLDPTLLLKADDYNHLIPSDLPQIKGNLMCYILDRTQMSDKLIEFVAGHLKMTPFNANSEFSNERAELEKRILPPIELWIKGFKEASFIITDSFHACVFSILFRKPFMVIVNSNRGKARIDSLLSLFNLNNRIIQTQDSNVNILKLVDDVIDYDSVFELLDKWKMKSMSFLVDSLK